MAIARRIAICVIMICFLQHSVPASAAVGDQLSQLPVQCTQKLKRCSCKYPGTGGKNSSVQVDNQDSDSDHRTVGLAAATGTLGGLLATGSALAAYFHFRGGAGGGGGIGGNAGEGGSGWSGGNGRGYESYSRPESTGSNDSNGSESPLTKSPRGRARPPSVSSNSSANTNIYKQSKVWPGR